MGTIRRLPLRCDETAPHLYVIAPRWNSPLPALYHPSLIARSIPRVLHEVLSYFRRNLSMRSGFLTPFRHRVPDPFPTLEGGIYPGQVLLEELFSLPANLCHPGLDFGPTDSISSVGQVTSPGSPGTLVGPVSRTVARAICCSLPGTLCRCVGFDRRLRCSSGRRCRRSCAGP